MYKSLNLLSRSDVGLHQVVCNVHCWLFPVDAIGNTALPQAVRGTGAEVALVGAMWRTTCSRVL